MHIILKPANIFKNNVWRKNPTFILYKQTNYSVLCYFLSKQGNIVPLLFNLPHLLYYKYPTVYMDIWHFKIYVAATTNYVNLDFIKTLKMFKQYR